MKVFTTASYYGSGSSAITDLLSEYKGIKTLDSNFECRIAYDMFGLSDLEYYLVENNHRHNSSTAINSFLRLCNIYGLDKKIRLENYTKYFPNFKVSVDTYIRDLAPLSYKGGSHSDIYVKSDSFICLLKIKEFLYHKFHKFSVTNDDSTWLAKGITPYVRELKKLDYYITYPIDIFVEATQRFTENLFSSVDMNGGDFLMIDQLVPASNTMRFIKYFKDLKVVCVDRDPRDIYYNEKKFWKGGIAPSDPKLFVEWYKATRKHKLLENDDEQKIMRIEFEDLIMDYDNICCKLERFLGLTSDMHIAPKSKLNPEISIQNIKKWKNDYNELCNLQYIKECLIDFYSFKYD